ncbi:MAG: GspH/FimT family pseudopilin [Chromatiales bacterium]|jgi:type IV fimbrial biogenesis protein FimT
MQQLLDKRNPQRRIRKQPGFTLLGTLSSIAIALSAYLFSLPLYNLLNDRGPVHLLRELSLASHLEYARQQAIRLEAAVTVCPSRDGRNCQVGGDWRRGWLIFTDEESPPRHLSVGDTFLYRLNVSVETQPLVGAFDVIQYQPDGSIRLN